MDGQTFVPINAHVTHSGHNYEFIGSFGVHKHHSSDAQSDHILRELRKEFYSTDDAPAQRICYRDCFKQSQRRYIEFCLEKRCNGAKLEDAAKFMGYLK